MGALLSIQSHVVLGHVGNSAAVFGRARHPGAAYACDPVIGDEGRGVYVREGVGEFFRDRALPEATIFPSRLAT